MRFQRLLPNLYGSSGLDRWPPAPFEDVGRLLEGFLGPAAPSNGLAPRAEVRETQESYAIALELPGVADEDLDLSFEDGVLTVRGEKRDPFAESAETRRRSERTYGAFERSFALPSEVDLDRTEARYERGVLTVTLPKRVEERSAHRIQIQSE